MSSPPSSPDPLRLSYREQPQGVLGTPKRAHKSYGILSSRQSVKRELSLPSFGGSGLSPTRSVVMNADAAGVSPWRIRVTVEAEPGEPIGGLDFGPSIPINKPKGNTITVPLKAADDTPRTTRSGRKRKYEDDDASWIPKRKGTPAKRSSSRIKPGSAASKESSRKATQARRRSSQEAVASDRNMDGAPPKRRGRPRKSSLLKDSQDNNNKGHPDPPRDRTSIPQASPLDAHESDVLHEKDQRDQSAISQLSRIDPDEAEAVPRPEAQFDATASINKSSADTPDAHQGGYSVLSDGVGTPGLSDGFAGISAPAQEVTRDFTTFTPLFKRHAGRDSPAKANFQDLLQRHKGANTGVIPPGWTTAIFSPLPPRSSPAKTRPRRVSFSSPLHEADEDNSHRLSSKQALSAATSEVRNAGSQVEEAQENEAEMWRSMIVSHDSDEDEPQLAAEYEIAEGETDKLYVHDVEEEDQTVAIPGDDTMMQSEEFSMVSINTLPSAKDIRSSFVDVDDSAPSLPVKLGQKGVAQFPGTQKTQTSIKGPEALHEQHESLMSPLQPSPLLGQTASTRAKGMSPSMNIEMREDTHAQTTSIIANTEGITPRNYSAIPIHKDKLKTPYDHASSRGISRTSSIPPFDRPPTPDSMEGDSAPLSSPLRAKQRDRAPSSTGFPNTEKRSRRSLALHGDIRPDADQYDRTNQTNQSTSPDWREKREAEWQAEREEVIRQAATASESRVMVLSDDEGEPELEADNKQEREDIMTGPSEESPTVQIDIWEEEASRSSNPDPIRPRSRFGRNADELSFSIDQSLPTLGSKSEPRSTSNLPNKPMPPAPASRVIEGPTRKSLLDTPARQRKQAEDIDAIFKALRAPTGSVDTSSSSASVHHNDGPTTVSGTTELKIPLKPGGATSHTFNPHNGIMSTREQKDNTRPDHPELSIAGHTVRNQSSEVAAVGKRRRASIMQTQESLRTDFPRRNARTLPEASAISKRQKREGSEKHVAFSSDVEDDESSLGEEVEGDEPSEVPVAEFEAADSSLTQITHASSSLLNLTPEKDRSKYRPLFGSSPQLAPARTPRSILRKSIRPQRSLPKLTSQWGLPLQPSAPSLFSRIKYTLGLGLTVPTHPSHSLLANLPMLPKREPFLRTHWRTLHALYTHCLSNPDDFDPRSPENIHYMCPQLASCFNVEIVNWGFGVQLDDRLVMVARIYCDLLLLEDIEQYQNLYQVQIDWGSGSDARPGTQIRLMNVLLRLFGIRCGELTRAAEAKGKPIDRRDGQLRWRFEGEDHWIWEKNVQWPED